MEANGRPGEGLRRLVAALGTNSGEEGPAASAIWQTLQVAKVAAPATAVLRAAGPCRPRRLCCEAEGGEPRGPPA